MVLVDPVDVLQADAGVLGAPAPPVAGLVVDDLAARRLITLDDLLEAMVWSYDEHEVAVELWVDVGMVRARMRGLTDEESAELERRLYDRERSA